MSIKNRHCIRILIFFLSLSLPHSLCAFRLGKFTFTVSEEWNVCSLRSAEKNGQKETNRKQERKIQQTEKREYEQTTFFKMFEKKFYNFNSMCLFPMAFMLDGLHDSLHVSTCFIHFYPKNSRFLLLFLFASYLCSFHRMMNSYNQNIVGWCCFFVCSSMHTDTTRIWYSVAMSW